MKHEKRKTERWLEEEHGICSWSYEMWADTDSLGKRRKEEKIKKRQRAKKKDNTQATKASMTQNRKTTKCIMQVEVQVDCGN